MNGTYLTVAGRIRDELEEIERIAPLVEGIEEAFRSTRAHLLSFAEFLEEQGR